MKPLYHVPNARRPVAELLVNSRWSANIKDSLNPWPSSLVNRLSPRGLKTLHDCCTLWVAFGQQVSGPFSGLSIDVHTLNPRVSRSQQIPARCS